MPPSMPPSSELDTTEENSSQLQFLAWQIALALEASEKQRVTMDGIEAEKGLNVAAQYDDIYDWNLPHYGGPKIEDLSEWDYPADENLKPATPNPKNDHGLQNLREINANESIIDLSLEDEERLIASLLDRINVQISNLRFNFSYIENFTRTQSIVLNSGQLLGVRFTKEKITGRVEFFGVGSPGKALDTIIIKPKDRQQITPKNLQNLIQNIDFALLIRKNRFNNWLLQELQKDQTVCLRCCNGSFGFKREVGTLNKDEIHVTIKRLREKGATEINFQVNTSSCDDSQILSLTELSKILLQVAPTESHYFSGIFSIQHFNQITHSAKFQSKVTDN